MKQENIASLQCLGQEYEYEYEYESYKEFQLLYNIINNLYLVNNL